LLKDGLSQAMYTARDDGSIEQTNFSTNFPGNTVLAWLKNWDMCLKIILIANKYNQYILSYIQELYKRGFMV